MIYRHRKYLLEVPQIARNSVTQLEMMSSENATNLGTHAIIQCVSPGLVPVLPT